jgi:hypothetical protein
MHAPLKRVLALMVSISLLLLVGVGVAGTTSAAPPDTEPLPVDVTGTTADGGTLDGVLAIEEFDVQRVGGERQLMAVGDLTGTLTDATGTVTDVAETVALPVDMANTTATCDILHLVLGPLDLNLLGLQVDLNQVVLDITAEQGPGNLLGNLLCAVAGLLDNTGNGGGLGGILNGIAALLNRILGALG